MELARSDLDVGQTYAYDNELLVLGYFELGNQHLYMGNKLVYILDLEFNNYPLLIKHIDALI